MCGRFYVPQVDDSASELMRILQQVQRRQQKRKPDFRLKRGQIRPGDTAAVLAPDRSLARSCFAMRWGFRVAAPVQPGQPEQLRMDGIEPEKQPAGKLVFNARSESAAVRPLFSDSMRRRRCVIPAAMYYEWDHLGGSMRKYAFSRADGDPLWLAGLYRVTEDGPEFSILTRDAAGGTEAFHDRMPVILPGSLIGDWLNPAAPAKELLRESVTALQWAQAQA